MIPLTETEYKQWKTYSYTQLEAENVILREAEIDHLADETQYSGSPEDDSGRLLGC